MTAASRFQRQNGSTGNGLSALGGVERSESGAYRGPFGAEGEDPDHDHAAVMTGGAPPACHLRLPPCNGMSCGVTQWCVHAWRPLCAVQCD
jgi:hypothetical protein